MDFRFAPEEEDFRAEVRAFLKQELPDEGEEPFAEEGTEEHWQFSRQFIKKLAARRWLALAWPPEYGGLGAPHWQQLIYNEEMAYHRAPIGLNQMGVLWVGPSIMLYGTEEQKRRYLPAICAGDDIWCTFYTEPGAGSDLAALQTRAEEDGDDYVVNGTKIFTTLAHRSQYGWLAARTDPAAPKHKGISTFIVDMKSPGITVTPLLNLAGVHALNQVFFDNVRIPKENLVGEKNRGWYQVAVALDFERSGVALPAHARRNLEELLAYVKEAQEAGQAGGELSLVRLKLADLAVEIEVGRALAYRIVSLQSRGIIPNYEASASKLYGTEMMQRFFNAGLHILGLYGQLQRDSRWSRLRGRWERGYLASLGGTVGGGTSEIQRNIIAIRGLGLPRG
ncbi:MAG: acyl-CoA dehydrogenase family protein [Chloroflexota bacterium]|nr:acyl-CoA dehydrogenase family protein [Chloroflexota bacterium]